ncbi:MAG: MgtC/SapB family protein [Zymomonas mobilis subsp. pomaceae]|uniref:Protein MgtC n=1 Tax=Zymomonas mobilis subsp. pomaceae (strain ATCC 29192 / DSM 22645 / JCM 10191 / CCUG 17912 / NBRC 13757 / NCIMB 11200 / NRRL B-4491 / Barker I) TaxID=579138 RepID=F8EUA8_ZYMMT|nr:MgtC/SapB family protein [Zymomonas mobilis]AEI38129.1 MgtC/SapB transporter [Zymomonas mobilis subsp. pomaceae ATCC 29192]MDX5949496.1 MgtC/SapB family protein [Zymomonas mobilis subsp. pomaceae]GEB89239.1 hypothetical protein ZMO02_08760 [Zymomonas mobilis subsp. pomaceae]
MSLYLTWYDIALRLALAMICGIVIGFDRGSRGHAAGLRTIMLVSLAAAVAMIQANMMLSVTGKTAGSFINMDIMRLPLGILTGVGFIGGGAILKRGDLITGVTTAATLWIMTVIGLCFGGGQLLLGIVATILGVVTLWLFRWVEVEMPRRHRAILILRASLSDFSLIRLGKIVKPLGYKVDFLSEKRLDEKNMVEFRLEVLWKQVGISDSPLDLLKIVNEHHSILSFDLLS